MGDDIGWSNIGVYNQGMMAGRTPNLDSLANEGMRFTDFSRDCVEGERKCRALTAVAQDPPWLSAFSVQTFGM